MYNIWKITTRGYPTGFVLRRCLSRLLGTSAFKLLPCSVEENKVGNKPAQQPRIVVSVRNDDLEQFLAPPEILRQAVTAAVVGYEGRLSCWSRAPHSIDF